MPTQHASLKTEHEALGALLDLIQYRRILEPDTFKLSNEEQAVFNESYRLFTRADHH